MKIGLSKRFDAANACFAAILPHVINRVDFLLYPLDDMV